MARLVHHATTTNSCLVIALKIWQKEEQMLTLSNLEIKTLIQVVDERWVMWRSMSVSSTSFIHITTKASFLLFAKEMTNVMHA